MHLSLILKGTVHLLEGVPAVDNASVVLPALTVITLGVFAGVECMQPKNNKIAFALVAISWIWGTTIWVTTTKTAIKEIGNGLYPSAAYWLTLMFQALNGVSCWAIMKMQGKGDATRDLVPNKKAESESAGAKARTWWLAGSCYFFGELFTVTALSVGSTSIVYVVKAIEPLTTALLAIVVLGNSFNVQLFIAIGCAGIGIIVTAVSGHDGIHFGDLASSRPALLAIGFTFIVNVGNSARLCSIKKVMGKDSLGVEPLEAYGKVNIVGSIVGLLPLAAWYSAHFLDAGMGPSSLAAVPVALAANPSLVIRCIVSNFVFHAASIQALSAIAVEGHALISAMKCIVTIVSATLLLGGELNATMMLGIFLTCGGVYMYMKTPIQEAPDPSEQEALLDIEQQKRLRKSRADLPPLMYGIVGVLMGLGCAVPILMAA